MASPDPPPPAARPPALLASVSSAEGKPDPETQTAKSLMPPFLVEYLLHHRPAVSSD